MQRELLHLYGPLSINSFGLFIIIGLIVFSALFLSDPKRAKLISLDQYFNILSLAVLTGFMGGRLLFVITNRHMMDHWWSPLAFWQGGFSLLGGVIAMLIVLPLYFKKHNIPIINFFDLFALYAPLLQSISRIGCFFAGCCFGSPTNLPFGVINAECGIPELSNTPLHPAQLYSSLSLFGIFLLLYFVLQYYFKKPGQLLCAYLFLMSMERFINDFWRADREFVSTAGLEFISVPQLIALALALVSGIAWCAITLRKTKHVSS